MQQKCQYAQLKEIDRNELLKLCQEMDQAPIGIESPGFFRINYSFLCQVQCNVVFTNPIISLSIGDN